MGSYSRSAETRERLIDAAGRLFAEHGSAGVSLRSIASAAGENTGSIHYHFGGKPGLELAVVGAAAAGWRPDPVGAYLRDNEALLSTPEGQAALVRGVVDRHVEIMFAPGRPVWHGVLMYQALQRPGPSRDYLMEHVMRPNSSHLFGLYEAITGRADGVEAFVWASLLVSVLAFLADYRSSLQAMMGWDGWPPGLLDCVRRRLVDDALRGVGLEDQTP